MKSKITTVALASVMLAGSTLSTVCADSNVNKEEVRQQLANVKEGKNRVKEDVLKTQNEIDSVNSSVKNITDKLNTVLNEKIHNEKKLQEIQTKLDVEMSSLKNQLANYYMNGFNSNSSILESLIKSSSASDFIVKSTHLKYAIDSKDEKVHVVENLLKEQRNLLNKIKLNQDELVSVKESLLDKQAQLEEKNQENKKALKLLNKREAQLEDILIVQDEEELEIKEQINNSNPNLTNESKPTSNDNNDNTSQAVSNNNSNEINSSSSVENDNSNKNVQIDVSSANDSKQDDNVSNLSSKGFMTPVESYRFTSKFGYRIHPVTGEYKMHTGVDLAAPKGTVIRSAKSGEVVISKYSSSYGNYVVVNHEDGIATLYAHLDKRNVSVGDKVSMGDTIGLMGSTGMSTGPHLHLEVRVNGKQVDPTLYIDIA